MEICQEKDGMIFKLQTALDQNVKAANEDVSFHVNVQYYFKVVINVKL